MVILEQIAFQWSEFEFLRGQEWCHLSRLVGKANAKTEEGDNSASTDVYSGAHKLYQTLPRLTMPIYNKFNDSIK